MPASFLTDRQMDRTVGGGEGATCTVLIAVLMLSLSESGRPLLTRRMVARVKREDCLRFSPQRKAVVSVLLFNTHTVHHCGAVSPVPCQNSCFLLGLSYFLIANDLSEEVEILFMSVAHKGTQ